MQVAPNAHRIESEAGGLLFMGQAGDQTLKRAAELTVANGYTHFVIADGSYRRGSRVVGLAQAPLYGSAPMAGSTVYAWLMEAGRKSSARQRKAPPPRW